MDTTAAVQYNSIPISRLSPCIQVCTGTLRFVFTVPKAAARGGGGALRGLKRAVTVQIELSVYRSVAFFVQLDPCLRFFFSCLEVYLFWGTTHNVARRCCS